MRTDIKGIHPDEELVQLLREVHVDEHDQRQFLDVFHSLVQKVLHAFDPNCPQTEQQCQPDKHHYQYFASLIETPIALADPRLVLVRIL